jgi:UDP-N-acetylmuramoyl-L-alanyl-D-glutamate--2,6-diaminopimelate ligase
VIALAGAGGDRDRDKRAMMGGALSAADVAVVTSDNPRSEDPRAIVEAVVAGVRPGTELRVEPDRLSAIEVALAEAGAGDVVLVLGRGHEPYQELADGKVEFDDRVVAARALENLRGSAGSGLRTGSMEP